MWVRQAEDNVLDRLTQAGLVAPATPGGYEEKMLEQIVTNLAVPNNLAFTSPIRCRVMLMDTVEATTVGNTILLSKGLIDSLPAEPAFASIIAMELAHIVMGHHIDTRYAFNDRLLFPDETTFQRIDMYHSDHDNEEAVKRAMTYLESSMYKDQLPTAGPVLGAACGSRQGAACPEYSEIGRQSAPSGRNPLDACTGAPGAEDQLGRSDADSGACRWEAG